MPISPAQSRAARALLNVSQDHLANAASVSRATIADFERELRTPLPNNLAAIRRSLEDQGILFLDPDEDGVGVRLKWCVRPDERSDYIIRQQIPALLAHHKGTVTFFVRGTDDDYPRDQVQDSKSMGFLIDGPVPVLMDREHLPFTRGRTEIALRALVIAKEEARAKLILGTIADTREMTNRDAVAYIRSLAVVELIDPYDIIGQVPDWREEVDAMRRPPVYHHPELMTDFENAFGLGRLQSWL